MKKVLFAIALILGVGMVPAGAVMAAQNFSPICNESGMSGTAGCEGGGDITNNVRNIINAVIYIIGIVSVGVVVYGGVRYTISQGDPGKTKDAKNAILYAVIGLVVAIMAYAIVNFVLDWTTSSGESSEVEEGGEEEE